MSWAWAFHGLVDGSQADTLPLSPPTLSFPDAKAKSLPSGDHATLPTPSRVTSVAVFFQPATSYTFIQLSTGTPLVVEPPRPTASFFPSGDHATLLISASLGPLREGSALNTGCQLVVSYTRSGSLPP